jgi:hypothetical protein
MNFKISYKINNLREIRLWNKILIKILYHKHKIINFNKILIYKTMTVLYSFRNKIFTGQKQLKFKIDIVARAELKNLKIYKLYLKK